jgi:hypothetical protein
MAAHKPLHHFEAKSADTRISRNEPRVARVDFVLANGESLVVEVPRCAGTPPGASKASNRSGAASRPRAFNRPFGPFP